jgi:hypothetical protein
MIIKCLEFVVGTPSRPSEGHRTVLHRVSSTPPKSLISYQFQKLETHDFIAIDMVYRLRMPQKA